ncbi:MAG TPA: hypothetical protein VK636_05275 [Gemmatimonadaceae bacterium]|nr:hypothetical protein [Gemmatimonadaceae bacterium]
MATIEARTAVIVCFGAACVDTDLCAVFGVLDVRAACDVRVVAYQATATAHLDRERAGLHTLAS